MYSRFGLAWNRMVYTGLGYIRPLKEERLIRFNKENSVSRPNYNFGTQFRRKVATVFNLNANTLQRYEYSFKSSFERGKTNNAKIM